MNQGKKSSFYKMWDVLQPFVIYYFLHMVVFYVLAFLFQVSLETFGEGYAAFMMAHAETVTGIVSGASMLIAAAPLFPMLKQELNDRRIQEHSVYASVGKPDIGSVRNQQAVRSILAVILAVTSSVGLNILLSLTGFVDASDTFQDVSKRQFGVAFGIGIILYGVVSPLAEEIVFRGLLYNRMRKYYPTWPAIVVSGLFFGMYHGNLVQGIYGTCMGILMAYLYERTGRLLIPFLFHAAANAAVYTLGSLPAVQESLWGRGNCAILLTISAICIICLEKIFRHEKNNHQ
ncbi:MAG: CPBP family intramembrane metalloprotease [Lachnospiraceae bacterium]|nr:CPBP family intramembrane metalloprotease [Lachnospiraceae bacterium]